MADVNLIALEEKLSIPSEAEFLSATEVESLSATEAESLIPVQEEVVPGLNSNLSALDIPVKLIEEVQSDLLISESPSTETLTELETAVLNSVTSSGPSLITGTPNADLLVGTNNRDRIFALAGNDVVIALNDTDIIFAGPDNDLVIAGGGSDFVDGESGDDTIFGESLGEIPPVFGRPGNDRLNGGEGNDELNGGGGNDRLDGGNGDDILEGDSGDDLLIGAAGNDLMFGGLGNDFFFGADGDDDIFGEDGNDSLNADAGNDLVDGGAGSDTVFGSLGNDILFGGAEDDQVTGGPGNDSITGGIGNDTLIGVDPFIPAFGFGRGEIDTLTGAQDSDKFVLGNEQAVFYVDGNHGTPGNTDYALITDFEFTGVDRIQLAGSLPSYSLGSSPNGLPSGTGIFFNEGVAGAVPELIGIVQNVDPLNLNLANSNQFVFV